MGSNSFVYAQKVLLLSRINPDTIAPSIDLIQFEQDLALIKDLKAIQSKLNVLQEGIKDTLMALGGQTLKTANVCYGMMKEANKATHALDETLGPILASKKHKNRKI